MRLKEFEGKQIFRQYGIPVPEGILIHDLALLDFHAAGLPEHLVAKAQVLHGARKKHGLIQFCRKKDAKKIVARLLKKAPEVLVEENIKAEKELYASLAINRAEQCLTALFSSSGGVDIEALAEKRPKAIQKLNLVDFSEQSIKKVLLQKVPERQKGMLASLFSKLYQISEEVDAELVEINPLLLSQGRLVAADAKIILDDNALFRHPEFSQKERKELTPLEQKAQSYGISYVELDGNIGIIGNGAGLVMASLDMVQHFGGKPSNFCDIGGGTGAEVMERALEILLQKKNVKGMFINIFAGITHCDEIAEGIIAYKQMKNIKIPMVIRMIGTFEEKARQTLEKEGLHPIQSMEEGARKMVQLVKRR